MRRGTTRRRRGTRTRRTRNRPCAAGGRRRGRGRRRRLLGQEGRRSGALSIGVRLGCASTCVGRRRLELCALRLRGPLCFRGSSRLEGVLLLLRLDHAEEHAGAGDGEHREHHGGHLPRMHAGLLLGLERRELLLLLHAELHLALALLRVGLEADSKLRLLALASDALLVVAAAALLGGPGLLDRALLGEALLLLATAGVLETHALALLGAPLLVLLLLDAILFDLHQAAEREQDRVFLLLLRHRGDNLLAA